MTTAAHGDDASVLMSLTSEQRRLVTRRRRIVVGWERAVAAGKATGGLRERDVTPGCLASVSTADGLSVSRSTLHQWRRAYRADGLRGLIDGRWMPAADRLARDRKLAPFFAELARRYTGGGLLSIRVCHDLAAEWAAREGMPAATLRESDRFIRRSALPLLTTERGDRSTPTRRAFERALKGA